MEKIDLTGKQIGQLTVIKRGPNKLVGNKRPVNRGTWICRCDCGKEIVVFSTNLTRKRKPNTQSCGCRVKKTKKYNWTDITGNKYGFLTVIKKTDKLTKSRGTIWLCKCDCGELIELPTHSLTSGNTLTCRNTNNHLKNDLDPRWQRYGEIPSSHLTSIKQNAIKKDREYSILPEYLWNLFLQQDRKCALTGIPLIFTTERNASATRYLTTASLDRIDSSKGYIEGNVRWVHKDINKMKLALSDEEFLENCRLCYLKQFSVNEIQRPTWDEYFLNIAFDVSTRSDDPNIRHGAIIVSEQNHIIGTGYNGTIRGSDPEKIPYNDRDKKRPYMIHAEENAILNCMINPLTLDYSKIYVTGLPCVNCLQRIINFGIKEIIYADRIGSITENEETKKMRENILSMSDIKITPVVLDTIWLKKNLF